MNKRPIVYLLLGTNIGDRKAHLQKARKLIKETTGNIMKCSSLYETEPWGLKDQPPFYNQVVVIRTNRRPGELMKELLEIEREMGRVRTIRNAARIIDIDILFYGDDVIKEDSLQIPHKEIQNRRFALLPMHEIAPDLVHPVLQKPIHQLLQECPDPLGAKRLSTT